MSRAHDTRDEQTKLWNNRSGHAWVDMQTVVTCTFPERELVRYLTRLGPVGVALQDADDTTRARVVETIRPAFDPFVHAGDVRFVAACWMISARVA